ncbi:MAG: signal recognition particle-docking protein FtsY [Candidatus Krumholzibacteriota bacterium]|nr:signal recognition particle-docking protein FtsY [Candidatus Krumholzibacteriota bacterium]
MKTLSRLREGLAKTRRGLVGRMGELFTGREELAPEIFARLEELLIEADLGVDLSLELVAAVRERLPAARVAGDDLAGVLGILRELLAAELAALPAPPPPAGDLTVTLVVGVNGVGKTTTAAKLARHEQRAGRRVLLAAADTFRAAASEQLGVWADRLGCDMVRHQPGADPAAVLFDALQAARARGAGAVIVDTAGRLHNKEHLMRELAKLRKVAGREVAGAPHAVLLVLDANTGQNAIQQSRVFKEATAVTGIVLAKLDGTARGGVVFAIGRELGIPVRWVGLGEGLDDLEPFQPDAFVDALLARE